MYSFVRVRNNLSKFNLRPRVNFSQRWKDVTIWTHRSIRFDRSLLAIDRFCEEKNRFDREMKKKERNIEIERNHRPVRSTRSRFVKIRINRFQLDQFFPITWYLFPDSEQAYRKTIVRLPAGVHLRVSI